MRIKVRDFATPRDVSQGYRVWIDTDTTNKKPDYYMALMSQELYAGLTKGWVMRPGKIPGTDWPDPYGGLPISFSQDRQRNFLVLGIPTASIGDPGRVRVAVSTEKWGHRGAVLHTDYLAKRHKFTRWINRT